MAPLLPSLRGYRPGWIRLDVLAGLSVWAVLVPESLAYATIAGVPPVVGLVLQFGNGHAAEHAEGGQPPLDPVSNLPDFQTDDTRRFEADAEANHALAHSVTLSDVVAADYDAVFYPGGHGPLWDLTNDSHSVTLIESFIAADKPVEILETHAGRPAVKRPDRAGLEGWRVVVLAEP